MKEERQKPKDKKVSEAVIRRLPKYLRQLEDLKNRGIERISSGELSNEMGLNASQIRQDFNCFGGFGQQGYGYQVSVLLNEIRTILGLNKQYKAIIIGAGNIGLALSSYSGFAEEGFLIESAFDVNSELIGKKLGNLPVLDVKDMQSYIRENNIEIAIICTQKEVAQEITDLVTEAGVKGVWNYAPIDVFSKSAFIENVHLSDSLFVLSYRLQNI